MRQIQIGAWLLVTCSAIAACNGEEFAPSEASGTNESQTAGNTSSAGRNSSGSTNTSAGTGTSGGGKSSTGGSGTLPPAAGSPAMAGSGMSSAGADGEDPGQGCAEGKVTFRMVPGADLPEHYLCDAGCGTGWLTITDADGASAFPIFSSCGSASCESCEILPCVAAACLPMPLTATGSELSWSGTYFAPDTCGANMACQRQDCVPAGKYKAKACAAVSAGSANGGPGCTPKADAKLCTEVEFDFPSASEITLVLKNP